MVNTSILQHLPPFLGEEFASIVSTENVQLLTSLLFHKYQPLLECSEGITFAFQKCNPYCNGYNTLTDILYIQPQSLFSISVYLYLLSDFSPFTTTPVLVPLLLHNRKRFSVLVGLKVLALLHFFTLLAPPWRSYCCNGKGNVLAGWKFHTSIPNHLHKLSWETLC